MERTQKRRLNHLTFMYDLDRDPKKLTKYLLYIISVGKIFEPSFVSASILRKQPGSLSVPVVFTFARN
jgi:hypothetical protein